MTTEERLERIENGWIDIQEALKAVIQVQANTSERIDGLAESLKIVIQVQTTTNERISVLVESIGQYVDASDARTRRLEDNLDALIRAITAEHSNGKSKS